MTAPTTGGDERQPDEAAAVDDAAGQAPEEGGVPNPETGAGLGAGPPNSFEPEEADPPAG